MPKKIPLALLRLLSDGEYHSGEAVGDVLGVSRAAVWKQLQKLESLGLTLESTKGKGYRLLEPLALLDDERIRALAGAAGLSNQFHLHLDIDSTNAELLRLINSGEANPGDVVLAESQQAGRGRRGREWVSPFAQNLYYSMAWDFEGGAASLDGLSLVVGLSLVQALADYELEGVGVKWPNDILVNGRKLAGILLEITGDPTGLCHVVIGIGVNVNMRSAAGAIDQPWTSLAQKLSASVDRNALLVRLTQMLAANLQQFEQQGFSGFCDQWAALDAFAGQSVVVTQGAEQIFGTACGVNSKGELLLEVNGQQQAFNGGEVSLRRTL